MKLHLSREDLQEAIQRHIGGLIILAPEATMSIEIKADGSADVNIAYMAVKSLPGIAAAAAAPAPAAPAAKPAAAPTPVAKTDPPTGAPKIDLRTKEGRELKKKGLFEQAGVEPPKSTDTPGDAVDAAVHNLTREPTAAEVEAAQGNQGEESSSIPADVEASTDVGEIPGGGRPEEAKEILAEPEPETPVEEAPPPPPEKPRKSLFGN